MDNETRARELLRQQIKKPYGIGQRVQSDAALRAIQNALTESQQQLEAARKALEPFAACVGQIAEDESDEEWAKFRLLIKDYRQARTIHASLGEGK